MVVGGVESEFITTDSVRNIRASLKPGRRARSRSGPALDPALRKTPPPSGKFAEFLAFPLSAMIFTKNPSRRAPSVDGNLVIFFTKASLGGSPISLRTILKG